MASGSGTVGPATAGATDSVASLDHSKFDEVVEIVALRISARQCTAFLKQLSGHVLHRPRVKPIVADADGKADSRLLLLAESVRGLELAELPSDVRQYALAEGATPVRHTLRLGYEHLTVDQVLRRLLPSGMEVPSAFEQVGHVAHMNLREEHLPYKTIIGQVLLEKNTPRIRSVVNKVETISKGADELAWKFRVFPMEVLAGDDDLRTSVRENGARFELDYRQVYWNSRLETEHKRILQLLPADTVVADVFAGIGPFAVPAAMRKCRVYANDLNPKSHEFLVANVRGNKVEARVRTYNLDGRDFIRALMQPDALAFGFFSHALMNLPASALTFLDAFVGAFDRDRWTAPLPTVHCYCFSKAADPKADVIAIAERTMGCSLPNAHVAVVRDVSPHKLMLCLEFQVPDEIAWASTGESSGGAGTGRAKRPRGAEDGCDANEQPV